MKLVLNKYFFLPGLASITIDLQNDDCSDAYAYIPDLTTNGMIVFSMRENDSWRHTHNYYSFNPIAGNLVIASKYLNRKYEYRCGIHTYGQQHVRPYTCSTILALMPLK
jgi:hypothetical protein